MGINSGGINKGQTVTTELTVINGVTIDSTTLVVDEANNLVKIGDDLSLNTDSSVIKMGAGDDVTITHDGTTGVTIAANPITVDSAGALNLFGTAINVGTDTDVAIDIDASTLDIDASGLVTIDSSGGPISIGATDQDQDINIGIQGTRTITVGVDNDGADATTVKINSGDVKIQNTSTTNGTFPTLTLQTGDNAIIANNILGQIDFQAPDDTGVDSDIVAASIVAIAEETFSDSSNATSLQLRTGASEVATTKVTIDSAGKVGIGDTAPGTLLQISGADPYLTLKNTTAENTDAGAESQILFEDHSDASLGNIRVHHSGSSDDTKAQMLLRVNDGSSLVSGIEITEGKVTTLNLAVGAVAQTQDHILFFDGAADGEPKVESIDDFLTAIAGSGISVSSSQLTASTGGASDLNGLSDVSFGSGDLVISALDLLTTSDSAHNAAGTGVVIRGGNTTAGTSNDQAGGNLTIQGGQGKGSGEGGAIIFQTAKDAGSSGNTLNSFTTRMTISQKGELLFGAAQDAEIGVESTAHDVAGKGIELLGGSPTAGTTNDIAGGDITIIGGAGKGSGASGEIKFQVIPAGSSGNSLNTTKQTQMTISQTGIVVNDDGNAACDFRVQGEDWPNLLNVDATLNQVGVGHDEGDPGDPTATLYVRNKNDNTGGNVPLVLLDNDNVDVIALDIDAANTATAVVTINADSLQTTNTAGQSAAFFMSCDALTTGTAFEINSASLNSSSRSLMKVQNTDGRADNVTMLHLNNGAHDNDAPFVLLEYSGNQTDHPMILEFRRSDNGSEASGMDLGQINFVGHDADNNLTTYVQISTEAEDVTGGGEDGELEFKTQVGGTLTSQLKIDSSGVHLPTGLAATAAASNADTSNGNVTSNNFKITHTLTLNGALADGNSITEFTVTSDKIKATSVVIASSNLLDMTAPREVVAGSFKISGKNKTGGTLADDSTVIINYLIL